MYAILDNQLLWGFLLLEDTSSSCLETPSHLLTTPDIGLTTPDIGFETPSHLLTTPHIGLETPSHLLTTPHIGLETPSHLLTTPHIGLETLSHLLTSPFGQGKEVTVMAMQPGQNTLEELRSRDFREELEVGEREVKDKKDKDRPPPPRSFTEAPPITGGSVKKPRLEPPPASIDADDQLNNEFAEVKLLQSRLAYALHSSEDLTWKLVTEDDTAELLKELKKIKQERAQEQAAKEEERKAEEERIRTENLLKGNPLLNQQSTTFKIKRRWDDDVVFKNCAKAEPKHKEKHFINDTVRSEFHRKFMDKYIK
eukprot:Em0021g137a